MITWTRRASAPRDRRLLIVGVPAAAMLALALTTLATAPALAHSGDHRYVELLRGAYDGPRLATGDDPAAAVGAIVRLMGRLHTDTAPWLLPPGAAVDRASWRGNVVELALTLPQAPAPWRLGEYDLETISTALATPFDRDAGFGGVRVSVRTAGDDVYGPLEDLLEPRPLPIDAGPQPDPDFVGIPQEIFDAYFDGQRLGGPSSNAARQPVGALTGVTVYLSAGHGWTALTSSWGLQRPLLLGMCEDYGNIDVLNYTAAFAFNAGATVVPLRPVGWQPIEIVLDNDDPGVTYNGVWSDGTSAKYYENGVTNSGVVYRATTSSPVESATARYTPLIPVTDFYPVYCFTIAGSNRTIQTYRIAHTGGVSEVAIDHRDTGNGWVWLGDYYFAAGGDHYVEITNQSTISGAIVADAIRFGCGVGDVVRPGPGTISGFPRDEEGQRYWAESEWGANAVGFDSGIWDISGSDDLSDNVGAGARMAREMNQVPAGGVLVDRWKRVHLEYHSNAFNGSARGQVCLTTGNATTNQVTFATVLSNEVDADMLVLDDQFEHQWVDRSSPTLEGAYGAISTTNNSNEFDATLVELAFHDNQQDAELLRDMRVRRAMARSCVQGIIRFLDGLAGSPVPLVFPPDTPGGVRVRDNGDGTVTVGWDPPISNGALGGPASGYVIYESADGYGFGAPTIVGNVTAAVLPLAPGQTRYYRVAATNAGGESMPSEVLAIRRPFNGVADILIVNGFDRLRRQQNPIQTFTQPPSVAGQSIERQIWRAANSFDYVIFFAESLAADERDFTTCSNEAVSLGNVSLADYSVVIWAAGQDSVEDEALSLAEQSALSLYLSQGGKLFISGSDIGFDLIGNGGGAAFMQNTLKAGYVSNDSNAFQVTAVADGILEGLGAFSFSPASGAPYEVLAPDAISARETAKPVLFYQGGGGGTAAIQYSSTSYNVVVFGFPFETIGAAATRDAVMSRVVTYLITAGGPIKFDFDNDGDVDINDFFVYEFCAQGPDVLYNPGDFCLEFDDQEDLDVDLADVAGFQQAFTGPGGS